MARPERFELPTTWFVARYSIQLSYGRVGEAVLREARIIVMAWWLVKNRRETLFTAKDSGMMPPFRRSARVAEGAPLLREYMG